MIGTGPNTGPSHKLSAEERTRVFEIANSPEFHALQNEPYARRGTWRAAERGCHWGAFPNVWRMTASSRL
jgi:hypothetical protein